MMENTPQDQLLEKLEDLLAHQSSIDDIITYDADSEFAVIWQHLINAVGIMQYDTIYALSNAYRQPQTTITSQQIARLEDAITELNQAMHLLAFREFTSTKNGTIGTE